MSIQRVSPKTASHDVPSDADLAREAPRILRRLCESGAVLALAADMDKAVVVRDCVDGRSSRTAVVDRAVAQAMALNEWISCQANGRVARYTITQAGRNALSRMVAQEADNCETIVRALPSASEDAAHLRSNNARQGRYGVAESPLTALARRKDKNGKPFLDEDLVAVGERLREDFELAHVTPGTAQNWDSLLTGSAQSGSARAIPQMGQSAAQDRVIIALQELGPGLSDVALRCCCYREGLEMAEKRLGWSARSGKIVLRIALQRLKRHYATLSEDTQMIG